MLSRSLETKRLTVGQVKEMQELADAFDKVNKETRHMIFAGLIDRVEVGTSYQITIKFSIIFR